GRSSTSRATKRFCRTRPLIILIFLLIFLLILLPRDGMGLIRRKIRRKIRSGRMTCPRSLQPQMRARGDVALDGGEERAVLGERRLDLRERGVEDGLGEPRFLWGERAPPLLADWIAFIAAMRIQRLRQRGGRAGSLVVRV